MNSNNFSTADYYTFPQIIQKEKSLDVPKCLHFLYIGKAIRDNYVDNIRQNLNQYFINIQVLTNQSCFKYPILTLKLIRILTKIVCD